MIPRLHAPTERKIQYSLKASEFGDKLPIIPSDSKVQRGSVLFRLDLDIVATRDGAPLANELLQFRVSWPQSHARLLTPTNSAGKATLRFETRHAGKNTVFPLMQGFSNSAFNIEITEAWYQAPFKITAYNCCDEDDFTEPLVEAKGVGKHKKDFLFGGRGVIMQGTGLGSDGRYIQITNPKSLSWKPHYAGVSNPEAAVFKYVDNVHGTYGVVEADLSIAFDPEILPPHHRVNIVGPRALGERRGDDTGGGIKGHHFDNYVGVGRSAMQAWESAGGNIVSAKVKYLGK
jgi:3D (Asp-Asp-Asp) domain-containing protein